MAKEYYKILGVEPDASEIELKKAFEDLNLKLEPDKKPEDCERLKEINQAYEVLSDPEKRKVYDQSHVSSNGKSKTNGIGVNKSISSTSLYTGPKLFAKPTKKSHNHQYIHKAINKALEGAANAATLKKMQDTIQAHLETCSHFLILFRNYQFKGTYSYDDTTKTLTKLEGIGPKIISLENIVKFFKFDSTKRQFLEVETKQVGPTIIGVTIKEPKNKPITRNNGTRSQA